MSVIAYRVEDDSIGRSQLSSAPDNSADEELAIVHEADYARMRGYALNLSLRPGWRSRIELRYGQGDASFADFDNYVIRQDLEFGGISYSRQFDNCLQLQGSYSRAAVFERFNVGISRNNWSMSLARADGIDEQNFAVQVGYSIPLGSIGRKPRACSAEADGERPFSSLIEAATMRPDELPRTPLTATDSTELLEHVVGW